MNRLNLLIGGGSVKIDSIITMNTMMANGDMGGVGMGMLAGMKRRPANEIALGFKTMLNGNQISKSGLSSISGMLSQKKLTVNGLTSLGKLYNDFGVTYVGLKTGNNALPGTGPQTFGTNGGPSPYYDGGDDDGKSKSDNLREKQEDEAYLNCVGRCISLTIGAVNTNIGRGLSFGSEPTAVECTCSEDYPEAHARSVDRKRLEEGNINIGLKPINNIGNYSYGRGLISGDNLRKGVVLPNPVIVTEKPFISEDEYVNEKLNEINDCFKSTYDSHLNNIEKTISNFEKTRDKSSNQKNKRQI